MEISAEYIVKRISYNVGQAYTVLHVLGEISKKKNNLKM